MINKIFKTTIILSMMILTSFPITASAEKYGDLTYTVRWNNTISITDCDESAVDVVIPETIDGNPVTYIDYNAFRNCSRLKSISIPDAVTDINGTAFENCTSLTEIKLPASLKWIGGSAFINCSSLTSITFPEKVANFGDRAFYGCTRLENIYVSENNPYFSSVDGVLYNKQATEIKYYPPGRVTDTYIIPDGVESIKSYSFEGCNMLTSITIPGSVKSIGGAAFRDCTNLKTVHYKIRNATWDTIKERVTIGNYNESLTGAALLNPKASIDVAKVNNIYLVTPTNVYNGEYIIFACYNGNELVSVTPYKYNGEPSVPFTSDKAYDKVKISVWESLFKCNPLCDVKEL